MVKALARAWRWQRMLDGGVYANVSEIGETESISELRDAGASQNRGELMAPLAAFRVEQAALVGYFPRA